MSVELMETRPEDALDLGARLSPADRLEAWLTSGRPPEESLVRSVEVSSLCWSLLVDGRVASIIGAGQMSPGVGVPWMLSATDIALYPIAVARKLRWCRDRILAAFPALVNFVYAENPVALRLVRGLGFTLSDRAEPFGWCGAPFYRFSMGDVNV
jgi:hypothetical protein